MAPASAEGQSSWWIYNTKRHRIKLGSHKSNTTQWRQKKNKPESQTQPSNKLCFSSRMPWHSFAISYCLLPLKEKPLKFFFCLFLSFFLEQPLKLHRVSFSFPLPSSDCPQVVLFSYLFPSVFGLPLKLSWLSSYSWCPLCHWDYCNTLLSALVRFEFGNQAAVVTINEIPPLPPLCHGQGGFGRVSVFPTKCAQWWQQK